jgi:hypothetical protein
MGILNLNGILALKIQISNEIQFFKRQNWCMYILVPFAPFNYLVLDDIQLDQIITDTKQTQC